MVHRSDCIQLEPVFTAVGISIVVSLRSSFDTSKSALVRSADITGRGRDGNAEIPATRRRRHVNSNFAFRERLARALTDAWAGNIVSIIKQVSLPADGDEKFGLVAGKMYQSA